MKNTDALELDPAGKDGLAWSQDMVIKYHYLHTPVDPRCRPLAYVVRLGGDPVGCLIFGRPQATRCYVGKLTYGSLDDVKNGLARFERWEVLNLARVWLDPRIQKGGADHILHAASTVIRMAMHRVGFEYLSYALPVDCSYPYQIRVIMSYCDTRLHGGWIYKASRFKRARINADGIETYMKIIQELTPEQDAIIRRRSEQNERSRQIRARRISQAQQTQMCF